MTWKAFALKWMIRSHRWMGMAFCLLFISFFVSGIVMMYVRMPRLTNEERLMRLPDLDFSAAAVTPDQALKSLKLESAPTSFRLAMFEQRPVYRIENGKEWRTVFADTGEILSQISAEQALSISKEFFPENRANIRFIETLTEPDQWTLSSSIRRLAPLHKVALNDADSTQVYISGQTGEVVLKTDAWGRFWGYVGAVFHWLYFTPLRKQTSLWAWTVIAISFLGSLMCVLGIIVGVWRFSFGKKYQRRKGGAMSPYHGVKRLHHWLGMIFGCFTFTWILSGMFSMNPFDWSPGTSPTETQIQAIRGGDADLSKARLTPFAIQNIFETTFRVKELEIIQFRGRFFYLGVEPPEKLVNSNWSNTNLPGYLASETQMKHIFVNGETGDSFTQFANEDMEQAAILAMPHAKTIESIWLNEYDAYYYGRTGQRNLPVLRLKFDDKNSTWLYLDPKQGKIVLKHETRSRIERWLYQGLHNFDFPIFYQSRPLWDIVLICLALGGITLSGTAVRLSWKRIRKR